MCAASRAHQGFHVLLRRMITRKNIEIVSVYEKALEALLLFLVAAAPFAFGAVLPWGIAAIEVVAVIMLLLLVSRWRAERLIIVRTDAVFWVFLVSLGYVGAQAVMPARPFLPSSMYPYATRQEWLKLAAYGMIAYAACAFLRTPRQIQRMTAVMAVVGVVMSLCWLLRSFGVPAPRGIIGGDHFGAFLLLVIPIVLSFLWVPWPAAWRQTALPRRLLVVIAAGIPTVAFFYTFSRGAIISGACALCGMGILLARRRIVRSGRAVAVGTAVVLAALLWLGMGPVVERLKSTGDEIRSLSFGGRFPVWQQTVLFIKDHPAFGTGFGTFSVVFPRYKTPAMIGTRYMNVHSEPLEVLADTGVVGFLLLAGVVIVFVRSVVQGFRAQRDPYVIGTAIGFIGGLGGVGIHSLADMGLRIPATAVYAAVIAGMTLSLLRYGGRTPLCRDIVIPLSPDLRMIGYPAAVCVCALALVAAVRPAVADYYFQQALNTGACADQRALIEKASVWDPDNAQYQYERGKLYSMRGELELKIASLARAVKQQPTNSRFHSSLAWAYGQRVLVAEHAGAVDAEAFLSLAHRHFEKAIAAEPLNARPRRLYALWLLSREDQESRAEAVQQYDQAIALAPALARDALSQYFKYEQTYAGLKAMLGDTPGAHYAIMNMLYEHGGWDRYVPEFKRDMARAAPQERWPYYKLLSRRAGQQGDIRQSIALLEEYGVVDPDCADAQFYLADRMARLRPADWDAVFAHYERALSLAPENAFYREWYARHLYAAGRRAEGLSVLEGLVREDTENTAYRQLLREWYTALGSGRYQRPLYYELANDTE